MPNSLIQSVKYRITDKPEGIFGVASEGWIETDKHHILRIIKETDPDAFISVNNVMGVFGYGFDRIKK